MAPLHRAPARAPPALLCTDTHTCNSVQVSWHTQLDRQLKLRDVIASRADRIVLYVNELCSLLLVLGLKGVFPRAIPELYRLPVASIDVPLPALEAGVVHKDIVHAIQVPMEVPHLQSVHASLDYQRSFNINCMLPYAAERRLCRELTWLRSSSLQQALASASAVSKNLCSGHQDPVRPLLMADIILRHNRQGGCSHLGIRAGDTEPGTHACLPALLIVGVPGHHHHDPVPSPGQRLGQRAHYIPQATCMTGKKCPACSHVQRCCDCRAASEARLHMQAYHMP